jgi:hypothetical protein
MGRKGHTFVKIRYWCLALPCVLQLCILLVSIVSLYVVPGIELEDIVFLTQYTIAKLEWVCPLEVLLWIMRSMCWGLGLSRLCRSLSVDGTHHETISRQFLQVPGLRFEWT